jgi:hypothetical protein
MAGSSHARRDTQTDMPTENDLAQQLANAEQKYSSLVNILSRMFDLDPNKIGETDVLIKVRKAFAYAEDLRARSAEVESALEFVKKLKGMEKPGFEQVLDFATRGFESEQNKARSVSSILRLVIAGVIGTVVGGVMLWKITGHP